MVRFHAKKSTLCRNKVDFKRSDISNAHKFDALYYPVLRDKSQ